MRRTRKKAVRLLQIMLLISMVSVFDLAATSLQESITLKGTVTDASTNEPLPGVTIVVKGTTGGTITDIDGQYSIEVEPGSTLQFTYVGFLTEEFTVTNESELNVSLVADIIGLDEVIVTGYGVQKKSDLTGAIASVKGDDLSKLPSGSFDDALKGRAAGVFSSSETGAPGARAVIRIRGLSSINGGDPLIIIDGVPSSIWAINTINASDIQSVEVLKDASSQAIYGASGGNGVILISTKMGEQNKLTTQLDYYYGYQVPRNNVDMMSTADFLDIYSKDIDPFQPRRLQLNWPADTAQYLPNTNWQDAITDNAPMQNINFSVAGGNEKSTFRFSTGYFTQEGVIPKSDYNKLNLRINSEHKISKRITVGENIAFTRDIYNGFENWEFNNLYASPMGLALKMHPFIEPRIEGAEPLNYSWGTSPITTGLENPFVRTDTKNREVPTYRLKGDVSVAIEIVKGLTFKTIASANVDFGYLKDFGPVYYYDANNYNAESSLTRTTWRNQGWYLQNTLNYAFQLGDNNISLMAGYESGYYKNEGFTGTAVNLLSDDETMHYFNSASGDKDARDYLTIQEVASDAYFGRLNYDYKGKYLLSSSIRRDQSSKFGPEYRSGIFPSFSLGWKFTEEGFMQNISWISFGKIRAGWGQTGNSEIPVYRYYANVITTQMYNAILDGDTKLTGVAAHGIANPELHWEAINSSGIGIDLTFFNNQVSLSADYYQKVNEGMLIAKPTPALTGTYQINEYNEGGSTEYYANLGEVFNKGYEFTAGYKTKTGQLQHNVNLNFSYAENEVGDIGGDTIRLGEYLSSNVTFTAKGHPMGVFYGLKTNGLFQESDGVQDEDGNWTMTNQTFSLDENGERVYAQADAQPGDMKFVDITEDGIINDEDKTIIGNPHPEYLFGFSYDVSYKIFDLSMFWQGAFGHEILQVTKQWLYNTSGAYNWHAEVKDRWTPENKDTDIPRLYFIDKNRNLRYSDFYVEPADYVRLKNVQLGCTIPKNLTERMNISTLRLYVSVKDLITISKYPGVDPEVASSTDPLATGIDVSAYPRPVTYTFGVNVTF